MDVTVDTEHLGPLVGYALNMIDPAGCCPRCCAPCWALAELLQRGQLDTIAAAYIDGAGSGTWVWWDGDRVDRTWLGHAWRRTDCHAPLRHRTETQG
jgi:hypothetical protein